MAQLEARKRAAVEREDYDMAKALKADIDKLRAAGEAAALAGDGGGGGMIMAVRGGSGGVGGARPEEVFSRVLSRGTGGSDAAGGAPGMEGGDALATTSGAEAAGALGEYAQEQQPGGDALGSRQSSMFGGGARTQAAYDERPAMARGSYTEVEDGGLMGADPSTVSAAMFMSPGLAQVAAQAPEGEGGEGKGGRGWDTSARRAVHTPVCLLIAGSNSKVLQWLH